MLLCKHLSAGPLPPAPNHIEIYRCDVVGCNFQLTLEGLILYLYWLDGQIQGMASRLDRLTKKEVEK